LSRFFACFCSAARCCATSRSPSLSAWLSALIPRSLSPHLLCCGGRAPAVAALQPCDARLPRKRQQPILLRSAEALLKSRSMSTARSEAPGGTFPSRFDGAAGSESAPARRLGLYRESQG